MKRYEAVFVLVAVLIAVPVVFAGLPPRFLTPDIIEGTPGNPQSRNRYASCLNDPVGYLDANGWEPNKSQATGPSNLIYYINTIDGRTAKEKLSILGIYTTLGGPHPSKKRYIYTKKAGWIDLVHFFNVVKELDQLSTGKKIAAWTFGGFLLWKETERIEEKQEKQGSIGTAWSYEDAPSNYYGWIFWKYYYNPTGNLSDQISDFLNKYEGTDPQCAPNWTIMWTKENSYKRQFPQNKSFLPKFTR